MRGARWAVAACAAIGLLACSSDDGGSRDEQLSVETGDADAIYAEARRIFQTRATERLRASVEQTEKTAIFAMLAGQAAAWNRGDLNAFMSNYWRSPELSFASGTTPVRGWADALRRYRNAYPDRTDMGELTLSEVEVEILAPDAASAFGHWRLAQSTATPAGLFTLVLRKIDGRWLIVHDHTTSGGA